MVKIERTAKVEELKEMAVAVEEERAREAKRDREEKEEERVREAKRDREEKEEEKARAARQKTEGGKQITVYVNTRTIGLDRKLGTIKLVVNSRDSIL